MLVGGSTYTPSASHVHCMCVHISVCMSVLFWVCMRWLIQHFSFTFPSNSCCYFLSCLAYHMCVWWDGKLWGNFHFCVLFRYATVLCFNYACYHHMEWMALQLSLSLCGTLCVVLSGPGYCCVHTSILAHFGSFIAYCVLCVCVSSRARPRRA